MTAARGRRLDFTDPDARVAGVDEVGRGPLAGPVVAAAVVLNPARPIAGLRDSKALSAAGRARLAREIRLRAEAFAVAYASVAEIDTMNILQASLLAMERAVLKLTVRPELLLVDGNQIPGFSGRTQRFLAEPVIGGDAIVPAISAASILAKVCRDRLLRRLHRRYPEYGLESNKGYPTRAHLSALEVHGPAEIHRRSFAPVRRLIEDAASR